MQTLPTPSIFGSAGQLPQHGLADVLGRVVSNVEESVEDARVECQAVHDMSVFYLEALRTFRDLAARGVQDMSELQAFHAAEAELLERVARRLVNRTLFRQVWRQMESMAEALQRQAEAAAAVPPVSTIMELQGGAERALFSCVFDIRQCLQECGQMLVNHGSKKDAGLLSKLRDLQREIEKKAEWTLHMIGQAKELGLPYDHDIERLLNQF